MEDEKVYLAALLWKKGVCSTDCTDAGVAKAAWLDVVFQYLQYQIRGSFNSKLCIRVCCLLQNLAENCCWWWENMKIDIKSLLAHKWCGFFQLLCKWSSCVLSDDPSSVSGNISGRVFPFFIWQLCHYSNPLHMVPCFFIWLGVHISNLVDLQDQSLTYLGCPQVRILFLVWLGWSERFLSFCCGLKTVAFCIYSVLQNLQICFSRPEVIIDVSDMLWNFVNFFDIVCRLI